MGGSRGSNGELMWEVGELRNGELMGEVWEAMGEELQEKFNATYRREDQTQTTPDDLP